MKISNILEEAKKNELSAFILGTIYAYKYKARNGDYLSVFLGRNQKRTKHTTLITDIDDQFRRIDSFYKSNIINKYYKISDDEEIRKLLKGAIGRYRKFINDLENETLDGLVCDFIINAPSIFVKNFIRGIIDSRSSADTTTKFVALDIRKKEALTFSFIMIKGCDRLGVIYNINPRFTQKEKISRRKNPQFRIPYNFVFGVLGSFKYKFFEKVKMNKVAWQWLNKDSQIPKDFNDIIIWNTKDVIYKKRSKKNVIDLEGDVAYSKGEKEASNEEFFAASIKQKYENIYLKKEKKDRKSLSREMRDSVWKSCNMRYFLNPKEEVLLDKNQEPLFECHHIIPHKYYFLFDNKEDINSIDNLVALSPNTHEILHRGFDDEKRKEYLKKLYEHINEFLNHQELLNKVNFKYFERMYL